MKTKTYIVLLCSLFMLLLSSCMNDFDAPAVLDPPYGNNTIGKANTTIKALKEKYASEIASSGVPADIKDSVVIEGTVIGDDASGNIYKQLFIADETGGIIISANAVGMYAYMPVGQKIRINCTGLSIGGYGSQPQIGTPYLSDYGIRIGRMTETVWKKHVRIVGKPDLNAAVLAPVDIDGDWLTNAQPADVQPKLVRVKGTFKDADGKTIYAPTNPNDPNATTVSRQFTVSGSSKSLTLRLSTYANFAKTVLPTGEVTVTGILTYYSFSGGAWQLALRSANDVQK